jgi:hypothetical protein
MKKSTKSTKPAAPQAKKTASKKAVGTKKAATKKAAAPATKKTATKKVTAKKAVTAEAAPAPAKKAPAKKAPAKKATVKKKTTTKKAAAKVATPAATVITAKVDVGFGNALTIRGAGADLSWDTGFPLDCVDGSTWTISLAGATSPVEFKLLVNDISWSAGEDYVVDAGSSITVEPTFE